MCQQGSSSMGMVLLVLSLGAITLNSSQHHLSAGMLLLADQRRFSLGYFQARSSLNWGLVLSWPVREGWNCQRKQQHNLYSCLYRGEQYGWLQGRDDQSEQILWRRVSLQGENIVALSQGWTDFCPFSSPSQCEPSGSAGF